MRRLFIAYLPLALWAGGVLAVGTLELRAPSLPSGSDKAAHFVMYGLGGALAAWAAHRTRGGPWTGLVFVALVAAADELNQARVPARHSDIWDWVADISGALVAWLATRWLLERGGSG